MPTHTHTQREVPSCSFVGRMLFRVAARRRRRMAVARLGEAAEGGRRRRRGALLSRLVPRFRLGALLRRSRRALARLAEWYAEEVRGLIAEAAAKESAKTRRRRIEAAGAGGEEVQATARPVVVVPPVVARAVLRCNSHYYIR